LQWMEDDETSGGEESEDVSLVLHAVGARPHVSDYVPTMRSYVTTTAVRLKRLVGCIRGLKLSRCCGLLRRILFGFAWR
jgi:hypothetical protein